MKKSQFNLFILLLCNALCIFDFIYLAAIIFIVLIIFNIIEL